MTVGDWMRVKRREKNLTRWHLALRMGLPTELVRAWETGESQPDEQQIKLFAKVMKLGN